jgi:elongation factor P hydroxylase
MDVGVFVLCFEEDFNYHLGEGKDDEIWRAHESWNHDGDTRKEHGHVGEMRRGEARQR